MKIRLVFAGRNYDLADQLPVEWELAEGATIDDLLQILAERLLEDRSLSASCLLAVSANHIGTVASHPTHPLRHGDEVTIIAPVAGG